MSRRWSTMMLALVALGCGAPVAEPLQVFPSRQELSALAREQARAPAARDELSPEQWPLELPALPDPNPAVPLLAALAPHARHTAELDCVAYELGRFKLQFGKRSPGRRLRQFVAARCGATIALPSFVAWTRKRKGADDDAALVAELRAAIRSPLGSNAKLGGVAIARDERRTVVVAVVGYSLVELEPLQRVVGDATAIELRGRVLFDTRGVRGHVNAGAYGVRDCSPDPAVAPPRFALRCELQPGDEAAWIQLMAARRGRVLAQLVHSQLALRTPDAARVYRPRRAESAAVAAAPAPAPDAAALRRALFAQINRARREAGLRPLALASAQSEIATTVAPALFSAPDVEPPQQSVEDAIALGLIAGWDVQGGIIRDGSITTLSLDTLDPERWTLDALEQPLGRSALLDPRAHALALGTVVDGEPQQLRAIALTYSYFEREPSPNAWARQLLERLARVRKARGLGRTRFVPDAPGMAEQLAAIQRGEVAPSEAMRNVMLQTGSHLRMRIHAFVWETQDFETLEFPPELLQKHDLTLAAGITFYRAPGGAWGQYTVLFVVIEPRGEV